MKAAVFAFTARGRRLGERLCGLLAEQGDQALLRAETPAGHGPAAGSWLGEQAAAAFREADALIFIGAAGIAVRAIAPLLRSKQSDPAVVVIDESCRWVISLLSGHIGGANALARRIAALLGAEPVITTATDINGVFAVDLFAGRNGLVITSLPKAKLISAYLLDGKNVVLKTGYPIAGPVPKELRLVYGEAGRNQPPGEYPELDAGILLSARKSDEDPRWLRLVPRIMRLGIGCRRGVGEAAIADAVSAALDRAGIDEAAVAAAGTITIKKDEAALSAFCAARGWPLQYYTPEELMNAPGIFTPSAFVESATGADNVCERAAVLASAGGRLIAGKFALGGVTVAVAEAPPVLSFSALDAGAEAQC